MRRPKVGELAIAKFASDEEVVCLVTGKSKSEFKFLSFCSKPDQKTPRIAETHSLNCNRLRCVKPKPAYTGSNWNLKELWPGRVTDVS